MEDPTYIIIRDGKKYTMNQNNSIIINVIFLDDYRQKLYILSENKESQKLSDLDKQKILYSGIKSGSFIDNNISYIENYFSFFNNDIKNYDYDNNYGFFGTIDEIKDKSQKESER